VRFTACFDTKTFLPGIQDIAEVTKIVIALEYCDSSLDECRQYWTDTQIRQSDRRGQYTCIVEGTGLFNEKEDLEKQILVDLRQIQLSNMRLLAWPSQSFLQPSSRHTHVHTHTRSVVSRRLTLENSHLTLPSPVMPCGVILFTCP
jgi:hypothetical protein